MALQLTESFIKKVQAPSSGNLLYFDLHRDAPRGFGLRVTWKGTKSFILRYRPDGRDRLLTIGQWPDWSLTKARFEASQKRRDTTATAEENQIIN